MKYAIVESGGKQYRAVEGETIEVDRLPVEAGANLKLEQVLLLADGENIAVGTPLIKNNPVWVKALEHIKGRKVTIFNYRPKKRIRVKIGHRQNYTRLLVEQIGGSELLPKKEPEKVVEAEVKEARIKKEVKKPVKSASKVAAPKSGLKTAKTTAKVETKASKVTKTLKKTPVEAPKEKKSPVKPPAKTSVKKTPEKAASTKKTTEKTTKKTTKKTPVKKTRK
jgi:large subunit ribosomal protein L21